MSQPTGSVRSVRSRRPQHRLGEVGQLRLITEHPDGKAAQLDELIAAAGINTSREP